MEAVIAALVLWRDSSPVAIAIPTSTSAVAVSGNAVVKAAKLERMSATFDDI